VTINPQLIGRVSCDQLGRRPSQPCPVAKPRRKECDESILRYSRAARRRARIGRRDQV